jgi:hypothetical protein
MTSRSTNHYRDYILLAFGLFACVKFFSRHGNEVLQYLEQSVSMMIH